MAQDLKDTLQLPKTDFPMRAGLAQREPGRVAHWEKIGLYDVIQRKRATAGAPVFVLHDGPPFTNGDVHIGTALNKSLKDFVNRYKTMRDGKYDFGFAVDWMRKDLSICIAEARRNGANLPVAALVDQFYAEVQKMGGSRWDTSALLARLDR